MRMLRSTRVVGRPLSRSLGLALAGSAAIISISAWAWAQAERRPRPTIVLHQDVAPPAPGAGAGSATGASADRPVFGPAPGEGQNPTAFASGPKILPEPRPDAPRSTAEPVLGQGGFAADRSTEARPDSQTGSDSTLQYVTVFNPSVLPFKRMSAMDAVHEDYTLYTSDRTARQDLAIGGSADDGSDLFWGSLMVELEPGQDVPIPSVSPDMRILSYETTPRIGVSFSKDGSDNFYVRSDESNAAGVYRLVFLAAADVTYFAPEVPPTHQVSDLARLTPPGLLEPLPPRIQKVAASVHRRLGVYPSMRLDSALDKLVYYFRGFEAKPLPPSTGDIYLDLVSSQAGVCRHRSFAFMITANALGIPTRYVTNEAHAWVEVWVPGQQWIRIDLGGAALRMQVDNAKDKSLYQPRGDDPFKSPDSYENNYTQLEGDIRGLSSDQIAEGRQSTTSSQTPRFDPGTPEATDDDPDDAPMSDPVIAPGSELPSLPPEAQRGKISTSIAVGQVDPVGYRGEPLRVAGTLASTGQGMGNQRVSIWMAQAGRGGKDAILVGHTVTDSSGAFHAQIELPDDMLLTEYEVYASTPGDARYAPAVSE